MRNSKKGQRRTSSRNAKMAGMLVASFVAGGSYFFVTDAYSYKILSKISGNDYKWNEDKFPLVFRWDACSLGRESSTADDDRDQDLFGAVQTPAQAIDWWKRGADEWQDVESLQSLLRADTPFNGGDCYQYRCGSKYELVIQDHDGDSEYIAQARLCYGGTISNPRYTGGDIVFQPNLDWGGPQLTFNTLRAQTTVAHEFGHILGLGHDFDHLNIMRQRRKPNAAGREDNAAIFPDDIRGIEALYGAVADPEPELFLSPQFIDTGVGSLNDNPETEVFANRLRVGLHGQIPDEAFSYRRAIDYEITDVGFETTMELWRAFNPTSIDCSPIRFTDNQCEDHAVDEVGGNVNAPIHAACPYVTGSGDQTLRVPFTVGRTGEGPQSDNIVLTVMLGDANGPDLSATKKLLRDWAWIEVVEPGEMKAIVRQVKYTPDPDCFDDTVYVVWVRASLSGVFPENAAEFATDVRIQAIDPNSFESQLYCSTSPILQQDGVCDEFSPPPPGSDETGTTGNPELPECFDFVDFPEVPTGVRISGGENTLEAALYYKGCELGEVCVWENPGDYSPESFRCHDAGAEPIDGMDCLTDEGCISALGNGYKCYGEGEHSPESGCFHPSTAPVYACDEPCSDTNSVCSWSPSGDWQSAVCYTPDCLLLSTDPYPGCEANTNTACFADVPLCYNNACDESASACASLDGVCKQRLNGTVTECCLDSGNICQLPLN